MDGTNQIFNFFQLAALALLIEALVQTIKPIWESEKRTAVFFVNLGSSMLLSIGLYYLAGLDIFTVVGVPLEKLPVVGVVATGLILSRGANFLHDLFAALQNIKLQIQPNGK